MNFVSGKKCLNTSAVGGITAGGVSADYLSNFIARHFQAYVISAVCFHCTHERL